MSLPKDPFMLLSAVNMKLRDEYNSLEDLCLSEGVEQDTLLDTLKKVGFEYIKDLNQFK